jgi:hypothetical protein
LSESIPEQLKPHVETLSQLFLLGCQDAVSDVAEEALKAIASSITLLGKSPEVMSFEKVISPLLTVLNKCVSQQDDDLVIEGLAIIQECCGLEQPLINEHLEMIVQFVISILLHPEQEKSVKKSAAQTLMDIIEFRPKLFAKKNLIPPTLSMLMDRLAKEETSVAGALFNFPHPDDIQGQSVNDEDDEKDEVSKLSQTIIDTMAIHIPSKYFADTVLAMISQGLSSPDPNMRKAGCAVLGVVAEGCQERLRDSLSEILPVLLNCMSDSHIFIRECACFALGQFSEHLQPEILNYHDTVLPAVFTALNDQTYTMQGTSCYVLEYFCEYLQPHTLKPYLAALMNKLASLAQSPSRGIQEMALTALSATAIAAEHEFLPYAEPTVGFLNQLLFLTEPMQLTTRGKALDCLGHIGIALGEENFNQQYFELGMRSAQQGFEMDNELLKEHGFVFIANIVKLTGKKFKPYMDQLIPYMYTIIEESEIYQVVSDDEGEDGEGNHNAPQHEEQPDGDGAHGDDEDDDDASYHVNVTEGFISTKKAAITALGALAENTKEEFLPHLTRSVELMVTKDIGALYSFHDDVRAEAVSILDYFVSALCEYQKIPQPGKRELSNLTPELKELVVTCLNSCVYIILSDEEKTPVSSAFETLHAILRRIGVVCLHLQSDHNNEPFAKVVLEIILLFLSEKAPCQLLNKAEKSDDGEENDDDDHDHVVIDSVSDLIGCLARLMGNDLVQYFDSFHPLLLKFTKPARVPADRIMAIGCYSEVFEEFESASILKYIEVLLPILHTNLNDTNENLRRNCAYCIGVLVEKTDKALVPHFLTFLQWLHPVCVRKESAKADYVGGADIDNAVGAVAKMIHVAPEAIPLAQVLPVMLNALPMKEDYDEGTVVFSTFYKLVQMNEPNTLNLLPQFISAFAYNFHPSSHAPEESKVIAVEALKLIASNAQYAPLLQSYLSSMTDQTHQQNLQKGLQQI